jgi:hypothetical protein
VNTNIKQAENHNASGFINLVNTFSLLNSGLIKAKDFRLDQKL